MSDRSVDGTLAPLMAAARRRALLVWYRRNRRSLPWRSTRDPWRIWVSEVMLQQTQVATATPYYTRFIQRFPTVRSFADARPDEVLTAWSGLGYYRRAKDLHAAAKEVVREHGGRVPSNAETFGQLPGVGRYTLGAVLSISFDRALPVLDGNVARVLSRWTARPLSVRKPADARELWAMATSLVPPSGRTTGTPGEWNQALMELGATLCTPRAPRCGECPVAKWCKARELGRVGEFPPAGARRATERVRRAVVVIERGGRVLLVKRTGELLDGLWEHPGVDVASGAEPESALHATLRLLGVSARIVPTGARVKHTITHRMIEVDVWQGRLVGSPPRRATMRWIDPANPDVALTALAKKLIA